MGVIDNLCLTNELADILSYTAVSPGGTDHPRVPQIVWNNITFRLWFDDRVSRLLILYCCDYSAKDVADWY